MAKYVIEKIELIKKQYVVDAYLPDDALELSREREPVVVEVLSTTIYDLFTINEHEYKKDWKPLDPDIGPDQLKDLDIEKRLAIHDDEDYTNISYGGTNGDL